MRLILYKINAATTQTLHEINVHTCSLYSNRPVQFRAKYERNDVYRIDSMMLLEINVHISSMFRGDHFYLCGLRARFTYVQFS